MSYKNTQRQFIEIRNRTYEQNEFCSVKEKQTSSGAEEFDE